MARHPRSPRRPSIPAARRSGAARFLASGAVRFAAIAAAALAGVAAAEGPCRPWASAARTPPAVVAPAAPSPGAAPVDAACLEARLAEPTLSTAVHLRVPAADRRLELAIAFAGEVRACLTRDGASVCRAGGGGVTFVDLVLEPGDHLVELALAGAAGDAVRLTARDAGAAEVDREREPNDVAAVASPLPPSLAAVGRLVGREVDAFRADVAGPQQVWRVHVVGAGVEALRYLDAAGRVLQERRPDRGADHVSMSNLLLLPGPHVFAIEGADADYALRLVPLGPAAAGGPVVAPPEPSGASAVAVPLPAGERPAAEVEREPNDDRGRAQLLAPGVPWTGLLAEAGDRDVFRFSLGEEGYLRLRADPAAGGSLEVDLGRGAVALGVDAPYVHEAWFLAGDHHLELRAPVAVDGYYTLRWERLDPFALPDDLEPNDQPFQARAFPARGRAVGVAGGPGGHDWYRLPAQAAGTEAVVTVLGDGVDLFAAGPDGGDLGARDERVDGGYRYRFAVPGAGGSLRLGGTGAYEVILEAPAGADVPEPWASPVDLTLSVPPVVAAYHPIAQRLELEAVLTHAGTAEVEVGLRTHSSDAGWRVVADAAAVALRPGERRSVPVVVEVAPGARDDLPVRITLVAGPPGAVPVTAAVDAVAVCGAPAQGPTRAWALPDALLGGLNVAWTGLGAVPAGGHWRDATPYDGLTPPGTGWWTEVGGSTTVRLAGEDVATLVGVLLHPLGEGATHERLADFRLHVSLDGVAFEPVFEGRLRSPAIEQAFAFDAPVTARYLRLEALSRQDGDPRGTVYLGEIKAIADPDRSPFAELDLLARGVGGHVAYGDPYLPTYAFDPATDARPRAARAGAAAPTWVVGFHHGRAAQVGELRWQAHPQGDPAQRLAEVRVGASVTGPLGPWTDLGAWRPHERPAWVLEAATWARYLRFEAVGLAQGTVFEYPAQLGAIERAVGPDHRSALGEWGHYGRDAVLEWASGGTSAGEAAAGVEASDATAPERAVRLVPGRPTVGYALLDAYHAYFAVEVAADAGPLVLELAGEPALVLAYELTDAAGRPVAAALEGDLRRVRLTADVAPGRYLLRAWEPPRSVVFAWDDSGSMDPYVDATYQTVLGFARSIRSEREQVRLLAFDEPPRFLPLAWTGDAVAVSRTLLGHDRAATSSAAEANLTFVARELAAREGYRAVFLVTDAESDPTEASAGELWRALDEVRPAVFAFETSTQGSDHAQDRMQDWAAAGGGHYDYLRTLGDLDVAFARVACSLRAPKAIEVTAWPPSVDDEASDLR